ncbi:MAG: class I SAM-dependent methyltransferase [Crenarchaeota archaeon]|nr:class I SAM-dependent methyltransferase [Thermoproteota archaeon]
MNNAKELLPWWVKIFLKIILSRMNLGHRTKQKLGIFVNGSVSPERAYGIVTKHIQFANIESLSGKTVLEMGPGDSLLNAMIMKAFGADEIYLIDIGDYANHDLSLYKNMAEFLDSKGYHLIDIDEISSITELLEKCNAKYLTNGLDSYKSITNNTIDFVFSEAVLEHIRKIEFEPTMQELYRIMKPSGKASHAIDFMDHLGGSLNNLRFSENVWESNFMTSSGFYTNRIRVDEMLNVLKDSGFEIKTLDLRHWDSLPIDIKKLHDEFRNYPIDGLLTYGCNVVLTLDK